MAVRGDLAEIAAADRVFAQHYVAPMTVKATAATLIYAEPRATAAAIAALAPGDAFEVLDIGRDWAWGRTTAPGTVGYVQIATLALPE